MSLCGLGQSKTCISARKLPNTKDLQAMRRQENLWRRFGSQCATWGLGISRGRTLSQDEDSLCSLEGIQHDTRDGTGMLAH